jgi:hypothetical protein
MKKNLVLLSLVAALSLMAGFAYAGAGIVMRIDVPFDFYLEGQLLPAGQYQFEMDSGNFATASHVTLWSIGGRESRMLVTRPGTNATPGMDILRFNKYDDNYFLSSISIRGYKATLKMLKLERELRSQAEKARSVVTVAQKN